jgi:hypothetical protein
MAELKGSKTHENLTAAVAGESQANRRYLYFAKQADIEGYPDVGGLFRDTAEAETGHAHGHLDFLKSAGDPATDKPIGSTDKNLQAAVAGETYEYTEIRRGRRLAGDPGKGGEVPRRALPEGPRRPGGALSSTLESMGWQARPSGRGRACFLLSLVRAGLAPSRFL